MMQTVGERKRLFVSGRLLEYWEHPEVPFGWTAEELQAYADRGDWVLLFNGLALTAPWPEPPYPS
jgi:hypothetical protein